MDTPIKDMLDAYDSEHTHRYHMPGHKGRAIVHGSYDITEIYCSDNLYAPEGPILKTQMQLARLAGSMHCLMLTDGASAGVRAMFLCLKTRGDTVLICRGAHRSVVDGCILAGLSPVLLDSFAPDQVQAALAQTKAAGVLITSPDYCGELADISRLQQICSQANALLLVDEAHGAHLPYVSCDSAAPYADLCVQSMHKTMGALTQAALLHVNNPALWPEAKRFVRMCCTSSPSYLILESMERAAQEYLDLRKDFLPRVEQLRTQLKQKGIALFEPEHFDPTRLCVRCAPLCSGLNAAQQLIAHGIVPEMADQENVVFILTPYDQDYAPLVEALASLTASAPAELPAFPKPGKRTDMRTAALHPCEAVPLASAVGRVSSVCAGLYPPGVPALYPGEEITSGHVAYLGKGMECAEVFGLEAGLALVVKQ